MCACARVWFISLWFFGGAIKDKRTGYPRQSFTRSRNAWLKPWGEPVHVRFVNRFRHQFMEGLWSARRCSTVSAIYQRGGIAWPFILAPRHLFVNVLSMFMKFVKKTSHLTLGFFDLLVLVLHILARTAIPSMFSSCWQRLHVAHLVFYRQHKMDRGIIAS